MVTEQCSDQQVHQTVKVFVEEKKNDERQKEDQCEYTESQSEFEFIPQKAVTLCFHSLDLPIQFGKLERFPGCSKIY